ncbi:MULTISPECIES: Mu transposase C-terminal domain-containing protein [Microbacterium]|uniref:Mu transposase C-terminal domain-containing protein n=1 Tax=Microbacterium TaxID=33882 RepID=UPI000468EE4D|nr:MULTISPECIES: Mu transposase C-terminal domain-containing protein [Microbacterium]AMG83183.1 transposase [Microbacterium sp. PAMC 28756]OSP08642.1 transposase [Microbacterium sp. LEMMJ01]QXE30039.1 DDE-type integrase/transposase/recombinase [Microbacterium paraoxydans]RUQ04712.1 transposase [Microbacterium sp. HSID17254]
MDGQERWRLLRLHVEDQVPLAAIARGTGVSTRTLQRWHHLYRAGGISALDPHTRADAGKRRTAPDTVAFVEWLALTKPRPSLATLHRLTAEFARLHELSAPSYATVREIVLSLDPALVTLALDGPKSYRDRHELVYRRRAERPNQIWQADHTELDILIAGADGKPDRPWLTTVLDDYSRAICGYTVFTGAPSALNTALALRQAIWRKTDPAWAMCGLPDILHVDHGSDFTSRHLERTAVALHFRIIHSAVARPQGRGKIERFFGTINTELLATLPGHLGPNHRSPRPALDLPALDRAIGSFVTTYNERPHRELGTSPRDAWIADGWLPRMPDTLDDLDGLLLTVPKNRVVQRDGIHFQGQRYLAPTLAPFVGRTVTIRYDPRDISEVRVYDHDSFICIAVDEAHPNLRLSLRDVETARRARRRELRRAINDRIPTTAPREEPREAPPPRRRPRLRTYEEDD